MRASFIVHTSGRGLHEITREVEEVVQTAQVREGLCCVFLRHTSASLLLQENADPSARRDLEAYFARLAPDGDPRYTHVSEGPDDMASHIRSAVTRSSETMIVEKGRLILGTWQGLFLFEHRQRPHRRTVEVKVLAG